MKGIYFYYKHIPFTELPIEDGYYYWIHINHPEEEPTKAYFTKGVWHYNEEWGKSFIEGKSLHMNTYGYTGYLLKIIFYPIKNN